MRRLALISSNELLKDAIKFYIRELEYQIIFEAHCAYKLRDYLKSGGTKPHLIIHDADAIGQDQLATLKGLKKLVWEINLLAVLSKYDISSVTALFRAGFTGVVLGDLGQEGFINALGLVVTGRRVFPDQVVQALVELGDDVSQRRKYSRNSSKFTARQHAVLDHVINGAQNKHIARKLELPLTTVKADIKTMMRITGAQNRTDLAIGVLRSKLEQTAP